LPRLSPVRIVVLFDTIFLLEYSFIGVFCILEYLFIEVFCILECTKIRLFLIPAKIFRPFPDKNRPSPFKIKKYKSPERDIFRDIKAEYLCYFRKKMNYAGIVQ
jgi:hypothetical protein